MTVGHVRVVSVATTPGVGVSPRAGQLRAPFSLPLLVMCICACTAPGSTGSGEAQLDLNGREASDVAFGMAEAFLNGTSLMHGEAKCLADSARHLAGNMMDLCADAAHVMAKLMRHRQKTQLSSTATTSPVPVTHAPATFPVVLTPAFTAAPAAQAIPAPVPAPAPTASPQEQPLLLQQQLLQQQQEAAPVMGVAARLLAASTAPEANWFAATTATSTRPPEASHLERTLELMEMSQKMYAILKFETRLAEKCLQGDAIDAMQVAALHLQNLTYMGDNIAANGAQILSELSYAVVAFDKQDYLGYGMALGRAARKALLAQGGVSGGDGSGSMGPEQLEEMAEGLMDGFFSGMSLHLAGAGSSYGAVAVGEPSPPLFNIDLRRCVLGNADFFRVAWGSAWDLMAAFAASSGHSAGDAMDMDSSSVLEIAQILLYMPTALRLCNVTHEQEEMMLDGLLVGQNMRLRVHMEGSEQKMDELVAFATRAWASHNWHDLGEGLGEVLQEMLHLAFPEKYAVREALSENWHPPAWPVLASCAMGMSLLLVAVSMGLAATRLWRFLGRGARRVGPRATEVPHQVLVSFERDPLSLGDAADDFDFEQAIE